MHTGNVTAQHPFDQERLFAGVRPRLLRLARLRGVAPDALEVTSSARNRECEGQ